MAVSPSAMIRGRRLAAPVITSCKRFGSYVADGNAAVSAEAWR